MSFWSKLFGPRKAPASPQNSGASLEQKLETLSQCGLSLDSQFSAADLVTSWNREDFEAPGFDLALIGLGSTEEQPPWRPHSPNVWHFDTECIEGPGSYVAIAERMKTMAQGSLPIENIADHVDLQSETAWLEFDLDGRRIHIDCAVSDDWVDSTIFGHFIRILADSDPSKVYVYHDFGGQDCIIACVRRPDLQKLNEAGVPFEPLR